MTNGLLSPRRRLVLFVGIGCLALAAATFAGLGGLNRPKPAAADTAPAPGVFRPTAEQWQSLTIEPVQDRPFDQVEVTDGRIEADADKTTQVVSPFTGRVLEVLATAGQHVDRRAPLFTVAASEVVQARTDLASATGALATAQAQLKLARETETRQGELYRSAGGALKDWRQAQSDLVAAQGQLRAAEATVGSARSRLAILGQSDQDIGALERIPAARAVDARATVYAPASGTVTRRALGPGQNITAGGDALFSISDLSDVWLTAQAHESEAGKVRLGATVSVTTPAYPGRVFSAKVVYVAPALDPDTRNLPVRAEIANRDGALKPGMFARFRIDSGTLGKSPAAPESAIIRDGDSARVWVVGADGSLRIRSVVPGIVQNGMVQITQGLKAGERIVSKGAIFIDQAGQPD